MLHLRPVALAAALLIAVTACGGDKPAGPAGPSGPQQPPAPQACRTFASARTITSAFHDGARFTVNGTCAYDTQTDVLTCIDRYLVAPGACAGNTVTTAAQYASPSDFIAEVSVVPPLARWVTTRVLSTNPGCAMTADGSPPANASNTYSKGKLTQAWSAGRLLPPLPELGAYTTLTYTAWDPAGRPTLSSFPAILISYDEAARTTRMAIPIPSSDRTRPATQFTVLTSYDADGNRTGVLMTYPPIAGDFMKMTVEITGTTRLCR